MLKLIQTDWLQFDLAFDGPADEDADAAVATLVFSILFTDREAPLKRVDDPWDRRGWYKEPQAGSGLWHLRRQPLTDDARLEAVAQVEMALKSKAPALTNINVQEARASNPAGNISSVYLEITGSHNGRNFLVRAPLADS
ncbi:MAG: phage GP46 family protein [Zoogloeaceae bacterium]|jgi:phage gp46-like protein|nr:phage GP46 family protein [Zoogloeaceae bacterium]